MVKDDNLYLGHMLDLTRKAVIRTVSTSRQQYDENEDLRFALAHLVQMIGEAANHVSLPTQSAYPQIPWKQIIGVRHRIVHDYMAVDFDILWEIVSRDLMELEKTLASILGE